jgi:hypothetical protein
MKLTNEIFNRYMNAQDKEIIALSEELGYDNPADFEEDIYIWSVNHGEKEQVMKFYEMNETEYLDSRELWADEKERGTK